MQCSDVSAVFVGIGRSLARTSSMRKPAQADGHTASNDADTMLSAAFGCMLLLQSALQTAAGEYGGSYPDSAFLCQLNEVCYSLTTLV
jgi:hypothetical protein